MANERIIVNIVSPWDKSVTPCFIEYNNYQHGDGIAVQLYDVADGLPFATVSVNVKGITLGANEFIFKTYGENEGMIEPFIANKIVQYTGREVTVGFTTCPIVEVKKWR